MSLSRLCSRCQAVIPYTEKICDNCKSIVGTHRSVRDKMYYEARTDKEYQSIYSSSAWKKIRSVALTRANGLCEQCMKQGKISYVEDVHHIIPIKDDIKKAYDISNLICLCRSCHIEAHKSIDRLRKQGRGYQKSFK